MRSRKVIHWGALGAIGFGLMSAGGCHGAGLVGGDCAPGWVACGDQCVDLSNDRDNCGACDAVCSEGALCEAGACVGGIAGRGTTGAAGEGFGEGGRGGGVGGSSAGTSDSWNGEGGIAGEGGRGAEGGGGGASGADGGTGGQGGLLGGSGGAGGHGTGGASGNGSGGNGQGGAGGHGGQGSGGSAAGQGGNAGQGGGQAGQGGVNGAAGQSGTGGQGGAGGVGGTGGQGGVGGQGQGGLNQGGTGGVGGNSGQGGAGASSGSGGSGGDGGTGASSGAGGSGSEGGQSGASGEAGQGGVGQGGAGQGGAGQGGAGQGGAGQGGSGPCELPLSYCDGACVDLQNDEFNCGFCGHICPTGVCQSGACVGAKPGHEIVIGFDYASVPAASVDPKRVLGNSVFLTAAQANGTWRLLGFDPHDSPTRAAVDAVVAQQAASHGVTNLTVQYAGDVPSLISQLSIQDFDALLVYDEPTAPAGALASEGATSATALRSFTSAGGCVVVLGGGGGVNEMSAFVQASGILPTESSTRLTLPASLHNSAPTDGVSIGLATVFAARPNTASWQLSSPEGVVVIATSSGDKPVVIHKSVLP